MSRIPLSEKLESRSLLCFSKEFLDIDAPVEEVAPLYLPVEDFEFHGAASEVVDVYFFIQKEQLGVSIGNVDIEEEVDEEEADEDEEAEE